MADHANQMAMLLQEGLIKLKLKPWIISSSNQLFFLFSNDQLPKLTQICEFDTWGSYDQEYTIVRFVTCFHTSEADVEGLLSTMKAIFM